MFKVPQIKLPLGGGAGGSDSTAKISEVRRAVMNKRIYWSLGVGLLGLLLVRKGTNWFSVTYLHDTVISVLGAFGARL